MDGMDFGLCDCPRFSTTAGRQQSLDVVMKSLQLHRCEWESTGPNAAHAVMSIRSFGRTLNGVVLTGFVTAMLYH